MGASTEPPYDPKKASSASRISSPTIDPENPFIAFRRFADSQVSSLLQSLIGLPSLFSQPDSNHRWSSIDGFVTTRRDVRVRAHQEWVEELERDMQEVFGDKNATIKRREDEMQKWGASFDVTNLDRPKCKLEQDREAARMRHEKLGWDGKQRTEGKSPDRKATDKDRDERFVVSTPEGQIDLRRVVDRKDEGHGFWMPKDDPKLRFNTITDKDPFADPDQAIAWLLTDDYSPLYLDRTLPYKLHPSFYKSDEEDSYFREDYQSGDLYPRFAPQSVRRHDPRLAIKVNWRAAFHDLLDVHHKGELSQLSDARSRFYAVPKPRCPGPWISYLVDAGSLGSQWRKLSSPASILRPTRFRYGNSIETWTVMPFVGQLYTREKTGRFPLAKFGEYEKKNDSLPLISALPEFSVDKLAASDQSPGEQSNRSRKVEHTACLNASSTREQLEMLAEALDNEWSSFRPAFTRAAVALIGDPDTEQATLRTVDRVLRMTENPELEDKVVEDILSSTIKKVDFSSPKLFKGWISDIDRLFRRDYSEDWKAVEKAVDSDHDDVVYGCRLNEAKVETSRSASSMTTDSKASSLSSPPDASSDTTPDFKLPSLSSSSSYSYEHGSSSNGMPDSIISTLTTVESRTLPDGRVETKRILKKRFADGREENSETTETRSRRKDYCLTEKPVPKKPEAEVSEIHDHPLAVSTHNKRETGGWFWT